MEKPRRRLYLDGYSISIYPVTNMEYRLFLDENRDIKAPDNFDKICRERPNHPVVDVSWDEASIYCLRLELYYLRRLNGRRHLEGKG